MASGLSRRPVKSDRVLAQEADGTTVLLSLDNGTYFSLNEVGGAVWDLCDGTRSLHDVVDDLCARYDASEEQVSADVLEIVAELASERLLVDQQ
jgi:pyrroloquinoline quinone biosynthesis protein D